MKPDFLSDWLHWLLLCKGSPETKRSFPRNNIALLLASATQRQKKAWDLLTCISKTLPAHPTAANPSPNASVVTVPD